MGNWKYWNGTSREGVPIMVCEIRGEVFDRRCDEGRDARRDVGGPLAVEARFGVGRVDISGFRDVDA